MKKQELFKFKPFSHKQLKVLTWWLPESPVHDKDVIIADGAVRSGKTISMSLSYIQWSMNCFNGEDFGMAGKTISSFRRNVLNPLKKMLSVLGYRAIEHRNENMITIRIGNKSNNYYIFGGKDEGSQDLIQGITLAGMLFDEVVLMPQSFVSQATARCSIDGARLWFNCNPGGLFHWFNIEYIKDLKTKNALYLHFNMDDNLSLSEKTKARYKRDYKGVFYKRFILGEWANASGAVYSMYDDTRHVITNIPASFEKLWVAVDYGTGNATVFLLMGIYKGIYYILREYYYDSRDHKNNGHEKSDVEYARDLDKFLNRYDDIVQGEDIPIIVDPSAKSFITQLRNDGFTVYKAINDVLDGIRYVASVMADGKLLIHNSCLVTRAQISSYVWNEKSQERGVDEPVKKEDHSCDALRYGIYYYRCKKIMIASTKVDNI